MKVREAMAKTISAAGPDDTIAEAARLMKKEGCGFIPITADGHRLVGVVTDRDIVIRCLAEGHGDVLDQPIRQVMSAEPLQIVTPDDDLEQAARLMEEQEVRRLAVVENGELAGILSHGNLIQALGAAEPAVRATHGVTRGA